VQNKPSALDRVTRIQLTSIEVIEHLAISPDILHEDRKLRLVKNRLDLLDTPIDPDRAGDSQHLEIPEVRSKLLRSGHGDHPRTNTLHRPCRRIGFRSDRTGVETTQKVSFKHPNRSRSVTFQIRRMEHGRISDRSKRLAVEITPHPQRLTLTRDGEVKLATGFLHTMPLQKTNAALGDLKPLGIRLDGIVKGGKHPSCTPLKPNRFVGIDDRSIARQRRDHPSMDPIPSMTNPKRNHILQQYATKVHFSHDLPLA